jgi:hypothetical protein
MNEKINEYLQKTKKEELLKRGLYEIKYINPDKINWENENSYNYDMKKNEYFEEIPFEVTDEEYNEIIKTAPIIDGIKHETNLPIFFYFIGIVIMLTGLIAGVVFGNIVNPNNDYMLAIAVWFSAFVSGMLFIGLGKIISLLNDIKNK